MAPDPRIFALGNVRREVPLDWWRARGREEPDIDFAVTVAPGVHVELLGWGNFLVPGGEGEAPVPGSGGWVAVWAQSDPNDCFHCCNHIERVAALADMLSDLDGYIERRAAEMAAPAIEAAQADAVGKVRAAEADAQRWKDCNTELERQIRPLRQRLERSRAESRQNAEIGAAAISRADALERELAERDATDGTR